MIGIHTTMMEASSPLAAMQPPPFPGHYGFNSADVPSFMTLASAKKFGPSSFNFKDLAMHQSMKRSNSDYFSMRPVRGSSPTASLAADLSQNFHIDQRYASQVAGLEHMLTRCQSSTAHS